MTRRLGHEDRQTVDLVLDGEAKIGAGNGNGHPHGGEARYSVTHHGIAASGRVVAVKKMLHLLDALPTDEPSADLLTRTMRRIEGFSPVRGDVHVAENPPAFASGSQPHA